MQKDVALEGLCIVMSNVYTALCGNVKRLQALMVLGRVHSDVVGEIGAVVFSELYILEATRQISSDHEQMSV